MASSIVIPSAASIGAYAAEVASDLKADGDPDANVAVELIAVATAAAADITALQSGTTAAMSTGVTVSNVWLKSTAQSLSPIATQINTVAGAPTFSSVPLASRTAGKGNGSFIITGDAGDTSTMDWVILN